MPFSLIVALSADSEVCLLSFAAPGRMFSFVSVVFSETVLGYQSLSKFAEWIVTTKVCADHLPLRMQNTVENQRWSESNFQTPTPLLFQILWIQIRSRIFFKFDNLTPVQTPATIDETDIQQYFYLTNDTMTLIKTTRTPATAENKKWLLVRFFINFCLRIMVRKKRRTLPDSTLDQ